MLGVANGPHDVSLFCAVEGVATHHRCSDCSVFSWNKGCVSRGGRHRLHLGFKRRQKTFSVTASGPAVEVDIAVEPLTKQDLIDFIASGSKPKNKWRIGTEHEKFGFELGSLKPMTYEQIERLLEGIAKRFNWTKLMEDGHVIGLKQGQQSVSLEPGGQIELSGAPLETLHQTCAELQSHLYQVNTVAEEMSLGFLGLGFNPKWPADAAPLIPKGRYQILHNYLSNVSTCGLDVMFQTCTVQVNLDFCSEEDMVNKFRVGLALQPIATALFANSPFTEGTRSGFLSFRSEMWKHTDKSRTGILPFVFQDDFGFEKYVEYALDVPMFFIYRNKQYVDCRGMSFRDLMLGRLPVLPGERATISDWENHLTTLYPEVRLKKVLEMRGADSGPFGRLCALPAFWVGLLYDETSLQAALEMISDWTAKEHAMLRNKVPKMGLKTPFRDGLLRHIAQEVTKLAKEGLQRRGYNEAGFLNEIVETANTEKLLEMYGNDWAESIDPIFKELLY